MCNLKVICNKIVVMILFCFTVCLNCAYVFANDWVETSVNSATNVSQSFVYQPEANTTTTNTTVQKLITTERVNFRTEATTNSNIIEVLNRGSYVYTDNNAIDGFYKVSYNNNYGYIKSEYLVTEAEYEASTRNNVKLLEWSEVKNIFTTGVDAEIYDVRTGLTYYVRSFSNGSHADVETSTKEDTKIMKKTYNGKWDWDPRPVWVTINGYTIAASINGMPHGGGVISNNDMNGQVCLHFKGSKVHNGNKSFERDHQNAIIEAVNAAK